MSIKKKFVSTLLCDFYKISHKDQYPTGTELVYSTWTPRASRIKNIDKVVAFGIQGFIKEYLIDFFNENFFDRPKEEIIGEYTRIIKNALGVENPNTEHIEYLHDLGYLPLKIESVPEGTRVPIRVPMLTIQNTDPKCFWLTNYIETLASCQFWQPMTSATIAYEYRRILEDWALRTDGSIGFVLFQGHDFSMRGMSSLESAALSGSGHLLSFLGTDTIPAITYLEKYYNADVTKEMVGTSIPATEHSVQCAYEDDMFYFKRMINDVYPKGLVSIVSDGYDFWKVISEVIPELKSDIIERDGKVVIRPDSGDPVKIICGDPKGKTKLERQGAVEALWDIFGGTTTEKGYKLLDSHIGLIYGDAITLDRCKEICELLEAKDFASTNMVYGIGSFSYQYNTRDTFGFALKATLVIINGEEKQIFKNPKTDDGTKKSQKGKVIVCETEEGIEYHDGFYLNQKLKIDEGVVLLLQDVFVDGKLLNEQSLSGIREKLSS